MGLLSKLRGPAAAGDKTTGLIIDGTEVLMTLRRKANARRYILRIDRSRRGIVVTLPARGSDRAAMEFAAAHAAWIRQQLAVSPEQIRFEDGGTFPLRGAIHVIRHRPDRRGTVWTSNDAGPEVHVAGQAEHLPRRLTDWLKREARKDLLAATDHHAGAMGLKFSRIAVRDQSSRWGSCSSSGTLSYSWRLILAPAYVLDYVAAHEVAHLVEMNHGPRFWSLVEANCPRTAEARRWLKTNGRSLHRYGL